MSKATLLPLSINTPVRFKSPFPPQSTPGMVMLMVSAALAIRLLVVAFLFRDIADPVGHYEQFGAEMGWIARSLASNAGFSSPFFPATGPTALLPPLYPFLLSCVFRVFGIYSLKSAIAILSLNSVFSALTCIPVYFATRIAVGARLAAFAGWAWAIYPFSIYFAAGRVWEFSFTSLLMATCFWLSLRLPLRDKPIYWLGFGLLYGVTVLSNPAVLSLFAVYLLVALWKLRRFGGHWLRGGLMAGLGLLVVLTPWTVRNYRAFHVICPVRDGFGYEMWSANNGDSSNPTLEWTHPASNPAEMELYIKLGETAYIAQKQKLASSFIATHKLQFFTLTLHRAAYYWTGFWSLDPIYTKGEPFQIPNTFFCSSLTLLMLFGGYAWWRSDRIMAVTYLLPIAIFPITYYVTHPLMDYRQAIEPQIVVLVVVGLQYLKATVASRVRSREAATASRVGALVHPATVSAFAYLEEIDPAPEASLIAGS